MEKRKRENTVDFFFFFFYKEVRLKLAWREVTLQGDSEASLWTIYK